MNANQENKFSMYLAVQKLLLSFQILWSGVPAFVTAYNLFGGVILGVGNSVKKQLKGTKGVREDTKQAKNALIAIVVDLKGGVIAYASANNNQTLKGKMKGSKTRLERMRDTTLADFCQLVWDEANPLAAQLVSYGVTGGELNALQLAINTYRNLIPATRVATGEITAATGDLVSLYKQGDKILKDQIDQLMKGFKTTQPEFYNRYMSARVIVDYKGGGKTGEKPVN